VGYACGQTAANTATGNQDIATGVADLKAIRVWGTLQTANGNAVHNRGFRGMAATGIQQWGGAWVSDDNAGTSLTSTYESRTNALVMQSAGTAGTVDALGSITQLNTDGTFRINWSDAPGSAWLINWEAWGGSTLSCKITHHAGRTATGTQDHTGAGFNPEAWIIESMSLLVAELDAARFLGGPSTGACKSATEEWAIWASDRDAQNTMAVGRHFNNTRSLIQRRHDTSGDHAQAEFSAAITDGVRLNFTQVATVALGFSILHFLDSAGSFAVGVDTQRTTNGTQSVSSFGFSPSGVSFAGVNHATENAQQTGFALVQGASAGAGGNEVSAFWESEGGGTSNANVSISNTKAIRHLTGGSTLVGDADVALDSGGYTATWANTNGTAYDFGYFAYGAALTPVEVDRAIPYAILTDVTDDRRITYGVTGNVTSDRAIPYGIVAEVTSDRAVTYGVLAAVTDDRAIPYGVLAEVVSDRAIPYGIAGVVSVDRAIPYAVLAAVEDDRRIPYGILQAVESDRAIP
jgi:hypothetical protein